MLVCEKTDILENKISFDDRQKDLEAEQEQDIKEKKASPYSRWTRFNLEHANELTWLSDYPKAMKILILLVIKMDNYNAVVISDKAICDILKICRATVWKNIKILKENGFIAILKSGRNNVYAINDKIFWKSWGQNLRWSKFPANVVLTDTEQNKEVREEINKFGYTSKKKVEVLDDEE